MRHIVSFSTGLSSAITAERVLQRYGSKDVEIVFMDTMIEDDDNYRFLDDMKKRWDDVYDYRDGLVIKEGRTPYQVAQDKHIIPNQKIAPCTFKLKIDPFVNFLQATQDLQPVTIHIGYDYSEVDRCAATEKNYNKYGWGVDFPLLWKPIEFRSYSDVCREDWGIEPPRMYAMGYTHANCGGRCVKQGQGDWIRTLVNFPERYAEAEEWERQMRQHPKRQNYAILRDQSNKQVRPKTLQQLREEYESGQVGRLNLLDIEAGCIRCGVGDLL